MDKTTFPQNFQYNLQKKSINCIFGKLGLPRLFQPFFLSLKLLHQQHGTTLAFACPGSIRSRRRSWWNTFFCWWAICVYVCKWITHFDMYVIIYCLEKNTYIIMYIYIQIYKASYLSTSFLTLSSRMFNKNLTMLQLLRSQGLKTCS